MKLMKRIICSILILLSIACMFLPVATSVDNRTEQLQKDIRQKENRLNNEALAMQRANDKVEPAAVVVTEEDKTMQAEINAAGEKAEAIKALINDEKFLAELSAKVTIDEAFIAELNALAEAIGKRVPELETESAAIVEAQKKLEEELKAIQSSRAFIQPVEEVDAEGLPVNLIELLQAEYDANSDVFADYPEEKERFDKWKAALDERYPQLQEERKSYYMYDAEGRLLKEVEERYKLGDNAEQPLSQEERDLIKSIQNTDIFVVTMIKMIRQQAAINEMKANPDADPKLVEKVQGLQEKVYKELKDINKQQDVVAQNMAESEAALAGDPIPTVYYSLLPNGLPVPDNRSVAIATQIKELEAQIKSINAEIAPLAEVLQHATDDGVIAVQGAKDAAAAEVLKLGEELKALEAAVVAANAELAKSGENKPVPTEDETKNIDARAAKTSEVENLEAVIEQLNEIVALAEKVLPKDENLKAELETVIAHGKQIVDECTVQLDAVKAEVAEFDALLDGFDAATVEFAEANGALEKAVADAQKAVEDKKAALEKANAELETQTKLLAEITGDKLAENQQKKAELDAKLADAQAQLDAALADQADHKAFLALPENRLQVDMQIVNSWGALYPTTFSDFTIATWAALALLVIALAFLWIPGNKLVRKFYTFSGFANLAAVLLLAYALLRLSALPIAQPYGDPSIIPYVAIAMLVLPLIALLLHSSDVLNTKRTMIYVLCISFCVLSLLPFWLMIVNATRSTQQIQQGVSLVPSSFLSNNWNILRSKNFDVLLGFKNSAIIAFGSTLLSVYFSALTAYGLTVYRFKGSKFLYAVILAIIMIPGQVTGTGFFMFMYQLEWTNSYLPLIIPAIASASTVFFFKQYLEANFQISLVEAARIDGAGEFYTFNRIMLPIMIPAMATMGIMAVIGSWNNYLTPLMLLSKPEMKTLPMMVKELRGDIYRTEYGSIYLGLTLTAMPLLIVYFLFSKYIIAGVAVGGVKE